MRGSTKGRVIVLVALEKAIPPSAAVYGQPVMGPGTYQQMAPQYPLDAGGGFYPEPRYRPTITTENDMRVLRLDISTPEARANLVLWYKVRAVAQ